MANQIETIVNVQRDNRNRITTLFRGILVFPVFFYIVTLSQTFHWGVASGMVTFPIVLTLLFRGVYPSYLLSHSLTNPAHLHFTGWGGLTVTDYEKYLSRFN